MQHLWFAQAASFWGICFLCLQEPSSHTIMFDSMRWPRQIYSGGQHSYRTEMAARLWHTRHQMTHVFSDASGSYGCGVFSVPMGWCQLRWPASWSSVNNTEKELLPIVIAGALWGHWWRGRHICFHCDNRAVVDTSYEPTLAVAI